MFLHATSLPHLLPTRAYFSAEQHAQEKQAIFADAWHLVGTTDELRREGDFLTLELLGHPVQVRNCAGRLVALSNVCAHRPCLLTHQRRAHSPGFRCQYHGWEYNSEGQTARIPSANNFAPINREATRLASFRVETCGQLIFVSLAAEGESLASFLGPLHELCERRFGSEWSTFLADDVDYPVNWKIPVENSLEAYHVPCIHPQTFREDPGETRSQHLLEERHTAFGTQLPFSAHSRIDAWFQRSERWFLHSMGRQPVGQYWHHHRFPNLLFSFTDAVSLCQAVIPTGPTTSRAVIRQFSRNGGGSGLGPRLLAAGWGRLAAAITRRILAEDRALYLDIQRGLERSPHRGILGRCEERIFWFQQYVQQAGPPSPAASAAIARQPEVSVP